MRDVDRISSRYTTLDADTSRGTYIDPLSPPWRHIAVDAADCNRRATALSLALRYGIRDSCSWLCCCCSPRCGLRLGRTGSREAEPTTGRPSRRRDASSSRAERASERSPVLGEATSRRVQNAKANRGIVHARLLARSFVRGALEESQPLSYHTLRLTPRAASTLTPPLFSAASRLLTFLRKSTNRRCGFFDSASSRRASPLPSSLLLFLPLMDSRPC